MQTFQYSVGERIDWIYRKFIDIANQEKLSTN